MVVVSAAGCQCRRMFTASHVGTCSGIIGCQTGRREVRTTIITTPYGISQVAQGNGQTMRAPGITADIHDIANRELALCLGSGCRLIRLA